MIALPLSSRRFVWLFLGVPLETLTVYQTAEHPDLEKNLRNYFTEQVNLLLMTFREYRVFAVGYRA